MHFWARIDARLGQRAALDVETRAHLRDSASALRQALQARIVKGAV